MRRPAFAWWGHHQSRVSRQLGAAPFTATAAFAGVPSRPVTIGRRHISTGPDAGLAGTGEVELLVAEVLPPESATGDTDFPTDGSPGPSGVEVSDAMTPVSREGIDAFAKAKVSNFLKRRGTDVAAALSVQQFTQWTGDSAAQDSPRYASAAGDRDPSVTGTGGHGAAGEEELFHAQIALPLDAGYGDRRGEGVAPTERDAETLAFMHAERVLDALGQPLFALGGSQRRHAEAAAAAGRAAPMPGDPPAPFDAPSPPSLRLASSQVDGLGSSRSFRPAESRPATSAYAAAAAAGLPGGAAEGGPVLALPTSLDSSGQAAGGSQGLRWAEVCTPADGHQPLPLTLVSPFVTDAGSARRVRGLFHALGRSFADSVILTRVRNGGAIDRDSAAPEFVYQATIKLPLALFDRVRADYPNVPLATEGPAGGNGDSCFLLGAGEAEDKMRAASLACMHLELLVDAAGLPLYPADPARQAQHAAEAASLGRPAPMPADHAFSGTGGASSAAAGGGSWSLDAGDTGWGEVVRAGGGRPGGGEEAAGEEDDGEGAPDDGDDDDADDGGDIEVVLGEVVRPEQHMQQPRLEQSSSTAQLRTALEAQAVPPLRLGAASGLAEHTVGGCISNFGAIVTTHTVDPVAVYDVSQFISRSLSRGTGGAAVGVDSFHSRAFRAKVMHRVYRASLVLDLRANPALARFGPRVAVGVGGTPTLASDAAAMHALAILGALRVPLYQSPASQAKLHRRVTDMGGAAVSPSEMDGPAPPWADVPADLPSPPPIRITLPPRRPQPHQHRGRAGGWQVVPADSGLAESQVARQSAPRGQWDLAPDSPDGFILIAPRGTSAPDGAGPPGSSGTWGAAPRPRDGASFIHTLVSPRVLDPTARRRLLGHLARHGIPKVAAYVMRRVSSVERQPVFQCSARLPVPPEFGPRIAIGEGYSAEAASAACGMHAELTLDTLGLPFFDDHVTQRAHARAARAAGRRAPVPGQRPQPVDTPSPPPLRREIRDSLRWLRYVQSLGGADGGSAAGGVGGAAGSMVGGGVAGRRGAVATAADVSHAQWRQQMAADRQRAKAAARDEQRAKEAAEVAPCVRSPTAARRLSRPVGCDSVSAGNDVTHTAGSPPAPGAVTAAAETAPAAKQRRDAGRPLDVGEAAEMVERRSGVLGGELMTAAQCYWMATAPAVPDIAEPEAASPGAPPAELCGAGAPPVELPWPEAASLRDRHAFGLFVGRGPAGSLRAATVTEQRGIGADAIFKTTVAVPLPVPPPPPKDDVDDFDDVDLLAPDLGDALPVTAAAEEAAGDEEADARAAAEAEEAEARRRIHLPAVGIAPTQAGSEAMAATHGLHMLAAVGVAVFPTDEKQRHFIGRLEAAAAPSAHPAATDVEAANRFATAQTPVEVLALFQRRAAATQLPGAYRHEPGAKRPTFTAPPPEDPVDAPARDAPPPAEEATALHSSSVRRLRRSAAQVWCGAAEAPAADPQPAPARDSPLETDEAPCGRTPSAETGACSGGYNGSGGGSGLPPCPPTGDATADALLAAVDLRPPFFGVWAALDRAAAFLAAGPADVTGGRHVELPPNWPCRPLTPADVPFSERAQAGRWAGLVLCEATARGVPSTARGIGRDAAEARGRAAMHLLAMLEALCPPRRGGTGSGARR